MRNIELVIFDCDGVLVDSEVIANQHLAAYLTEIGLSTTLEQSIAKYMGRSMAACIADISEELGRPFTEDDLNQVQSRTFASFEKDLLPVQGIEQVLKSLAVPSCVASSGRHEKMQLTLGKTGLLAFFEGRIFSATEVARGKPFPDLFLYAAEKMGFAPSSVAVVEDSIPGVKAAQAANMTVFGYAALMSSAELSAAGAQVFSDMTELLHLLPVNNNGY